ncbi:MULTISPECIES: Rne/Rng family ribonuclease [unclassified Romboutsia]|uniref:Rne/Rng family ribonuclease n=1 Tax=unclassified Romboutsia TaxID=2626894 RepID=UPI001896D6FD|nr:MULTISPECIES: Rne/Rng family ribonuclease [unclassified Romboutsia]MDB8804093.1 Rne/Rng family ribonuclease [Romboutsia sp. 1001216sp1]MDB8807271.1 Rne/Rng family ribonuclease [Romboutsia sp. 1001216sp1]MDB8809739.1 Rne/Rng family ribonuclease [Romboutsia sp. 1001216sp1]MDB8815489.1 Rne/Rng family ribonuclease [Romboutsia sp. 1001216sp1]MDB8818181.1 Rne/Rng family ribonuclease [Romboutsia sp. 1001216sp1]
MKDIIIESLISSEKVAVLEDNKLSEVYIEDNKNNKKVSNIYRGIVKKVLPGIEACFVDIGFDRLAYLQLKKEDNIKAGQEIMVQVNKEEIGNKGAKLNLEISLSGRYIVYIPSNDRITMSNKITDEKERFRLKKLAKSIIKDNTGIIIRTEAVGCSLEDLKEDIENLKSQYELILKEFKLGIGPKLLYKSLDFASKYIKDYISEDLGKIVTNDEKKYNELKELLKSIDKKYVGKIILEKNKDVFDIYNVNSQIQKCLNKKVWLSSGGYLIIEKTEALTVIDVNTGKNIGNIKLRDTIYKTNLEAAIEIARQIKIRDISGIIIIDFIDMEKESQKRELIKVLEEELSKDKRKSKVLGMTKLGLVEIARRREKDPIYNYYLDECNLCKGDSFVISTKTIIDNIEKETMRIKEHTSYNNITIEINKKVYEDINKNFEDIIKSISKKYSINLELKGLPEINIEKVNIIYNS